MSDTNGSVVVATALDEGSDEALRQGVEIARSRGVACTACHVLPEILGIRPLFPQLQEIDRETATTVHAAATAMFGLQARRTVPAGAPVPPLRLEVGTPHVGVLRAAEEDEASLIVVGAGSRSDAVSLGGVAERIVRHAHCPVLIARRPTGGPVLAATDFSDPALPAIEAGAAEARRRGLPLALVHVLDLFHPVGASPEAAAMVSAAIYDQYLKYSDARLKEIAVRYGASAGTLLRVGHAAEAILETHEELKTELLVVGTHGRSAMMRVALGSVAEAIVRRARSSVLVVRLHS